MALGMLRSKLKLAASMLKLFKKLLGKSESKAPEKAAPVRSVVAAPVAGQPAQPSTERPATQAIPVPQGGHVEVAHLSLAAIINKLPDEMKGLVAQLPDPSATVALPVSIIHKQLASGSVKMSLASLHRQAPAGVFHPLRGEERRMVEVPLSEVFRHVNAQGLRRREQRRIDLPGDAVAVFGDSSNPYAVAPAVPEESTSSAAPALPPPDMAPPVERVLKPSEDMFALGSAAAEEPAPVHSVQPQPRLAVAPPAAPQAAPKEAIPAPDAPLLLPVADLAANWPEPIRSEALGLNGVSVALPVAAVTAGLARGKVVFTWGQIRSWLYPPPSAPTEAKEGTELQLPLKIVAPAFLAHSRPSAKRRSFQVDPSIPALFSGGNAVPVQEKAPEPEAPAAPEAEIPLAVAPVPVALVPTPVEALPPVPAPPPAPSAPNPESAKALGELFGQTDRNHWTPQELVKAVVSLPGVAGAIVGLQEGLVVAAQLPSHMKDETVAAFLPEMFARLAKYTGEMALGDVEDLLFTTNGAHFQVYRLGEVYFAVIGEVGAVLPWEGLRLVAEELARQNSK